MGNINIMKGPFEGKAESLQSFQCPDWFRDAKFGIWSHWNPQSVPMYGDWYARNMYVEGSPQYLHHWRMYGHPSTCGYKDLIKLWKAENFDPAELMKLFVDAGARYFVGQAVHHDNFDNFDSFHPWNSVKMGPKKDICALWQAEAKRYGLPFGLSEHLGASYTWMSASHGADKSGPYAGVPYDGASPEYESLYRNNDSEQLITDDGWHWYTKNPKCHDDWFHRVRQIIDKFKPDLLYTDGGVPFGDYGHAIVAHLYNTSAANHNGINQAVYNFKHAANREKPTGIGVLDIERGLASEPISEPWQDDTSFGECVYDVKDHYKTAKDIADLLVDIVAKNGNLLLIVTQKPDGTVDEETRYSLNCIGAWLRANGAGIYGTRPYEPYKEGKTVMAGGSMKESRVNWQCTDFRFTKKPGSVFAFMMGADGKEQATIETLGKNSVKEIDSVFVSGCSAEFVQKDGALLVRLPKELNRSMPVCIQADFKR